MVSTSPAPWLLVDRIRPKYPTEREQIACSGAVWVRSYRTAQGALPMRYGLSCILAILLPLPGLAAEQSQPEAEVTIDRIDWFASGKCSIALTLKNPNAAPLTVTGIVVLEQSADNALGRVAAVFPPAAPGGQSSIELPVSLELLGGRPCAPPLTAAFRAETLRLEGTDQAIEQPLWLNVAADFDRAAP